MRIRSRGDLDSQDSLLAIISRIFHRALFFYSYSNDRSLTRDGEKNI